MAKLVLVRHGKSAWNALGLWTGWTDVDLTKDGIAEAKTAGETLKDIHFDVAYTSLLKRAKQTLEEIKGVIGQKDLLTIEDGALNERNYGEYTGKNKWDIQKEVGEDRFLRIRRNWDEPIPKGETLKDVYHRVIPYYQAEILPRLEKGENVLLVAHGNSLRALVKYLETISDEGIATLEIATGEAYVYDIDEAGKVLKKSIRASRENTV